MGVASGYGLMAVNIAYTMLSIPLALHYLGKEEFGLWALAQQVSGYLMLIDLGISTAVSRFVANHKDDVNGGEYGSLLLTGGIVFAIQGGIIALAGIAFSWLAPTLFGLHGIFAVAFRNVLIILTSLSGLSFAFRSIGAPLWAFHRVDVANALGMFNLISSFSVLWIGFHFGWGIYSFAFAGIPSFAAGVVIPAWICYRNGYYPSSGCWGRPRWNIFKTVFLFGKDMVLLSLGSQLVSASQITIISRVAGLDAAATFAIGTKLFTMGQQLVSKVFESSSPALVEMLVRGENALFNIRYWNVAALTALFATLGASALVLGNTAFIHIWTGGVIHWSLFEDGLLAALLISTTLTRSIGSVIGLTTDLRPIRYTYIIEGLVFVAIAIPTVKHFGVIGVLAASLICNIGITGAIFYRAASRVLKTMRPLIRFALAPCFITSCAFVVSVVFVAFSLKPFLTIALTPCIVAMFAGVSWLLVLPYALREEMIAKAHILFNKLVLSRSA